MVVSGVSIKRVGAQTAHRVRTDLPPCRLGVPVVSVSLPIRRAVESLEQGAEGVFIQGRELGFRAGQVLLPGGGVPDFRAVPDPMTTSWSPSPAYCRRIGGMVMRPCLSGSSSEAPERNTRRKSRAARPGRGALRIRSWMRSNSAEGKRTGIVPDRGSERGLLRVPHGIWRGG